VTLQRWLETRGLDYRRRAEALQRARRKVGARDVAAFVLFTPRQSYERAVVEWRRWRRTGEVRGSFAATRARYIAALPGSNRWYGRRPGESGAEWCARFESLAGLGPAKAPFLCSLLAPLAIDIPVCLDVWMLRVLGAANPDRPSRGSFRWAEHKLQRWTRAIGWRPFPLQWAIWDYVRTAGANGQTLFVQQTDIARDLVGPEGLGV